VEIPDFRNNLILVGNMYKGRDVVSVTFYYVSQSHEDMGIITYRLTVYDTHGQEKAVTKSINITDSRDFDGTAILKLPESTYEGHTVEAMDQSEFQVDGQFYSARRMYEENLASNRFTASSGSSASFRKLGLTSSEITFPKKGNYSVTLRVDTKDGKRLTDIKPIEVLKTPTIIANLTGVQKQNRKQVLNITVASNPSYPITEVWAQIESADGTESVKLYKDGELENSDTIKTRPIYDMASDQFFTKCKLEFLTKDTETSEYKYTIFAKDSRGFTDQVQAPFTVEPDNPPDAAINVEDVFIRNQGTNVAQITVEDGTTTDGDQVERNWYVKSREGNWESLKALPGYNDLSFGTSKKVSFNRTGVGLVELRLEAKDVWVEETLPEYITEDDYLSSSTESQTDVINIAPVVSIEPIRTKTASILMLGAGKEEYQTLLTGRASLMEQLIEKGIDASVLIDKMEPKAQDSRGTDTKVSVSLPFGYNGDSTFLNTKWFTVDNSSLYTINATWTSSYHDYYPQMPYYITSYDIETGNINWTYTINSDVMNIPGSGTQNAGSFAQDDTGTYLFFRYGGQTLVLSKDTGAYLTKLNTTLGDSNFIYNNAIYTVQPDGIYSISTQNGNVKKVYSGSISGKSRRLDNQVHFMVKTGPVEISRATLDLATEKVSLRKLSGAANDPIGTTYNCLGIDVEGVMIVGINNSKSVRVYGRDNTLIKTLSGWSTARTFSVMPVYDERGKCSYIVAAWEVRGSSTYRSWGGAWGIYDEFRASREISSSNGFQADAGKPMYAGKIGDEIYFQLGSMWAGLWGGGSVMSYYTEYATCYIFNTITGTATRSTTAPFAYGAAGEFAARDEAAMATSYTYNVDQQEVYQQGLNAKVVTWRQNIDEILYRHLAKYGVGNEDINTVVLYDNTNDDETTQFPKSLSLLQDVGIDFVFVRDPEGDTGIADITESYGRRLADSLTAVGQRATTYLKASQFIKGLAELIAQEEETPIALIAVSNESGSGSSSISREFHLDPDKTYYYEYQMKEVTHTAIEQPLHWEFGTMQAVPEEKLLEEAYRVTDIYLEDFNDDKYNDFFSNIAGGRQTGGTYSLATLNSGKTSLPNRVYTDSSDIRFMVPEGQKAILSFDYTARSNDTDWTNVSFYLNGKRWDRLQYSQTISGNYTSSDFLPEGENVLSASCIDYGTRPFNTWAAIDNLRVIYVEPNQGTQETPNASYGILTEEDSEDGWTSYKGTLRTSFETTAYRGQPMEYFYTDFTGEASQLAIRDVSNPDRKNLQINIPQGKYSINSGVNILSYPSSSSRNSWNVTWNWTTGGRTWIDYGRVEYGTVPMDIPSPALRLSLPTISGTQNFTQQARAYNGSSGQFASVELFIVDEVNEPINQGKYFFDKERGVVYIENDKFLKKATFTFNGGDADKWFIKDFSIYSIENGVKVYVTDEKVDSKQITKWSKDNATIDIVKATKEQQEEKEEEGLVYKKGQLVAYDIFYSDYEEDPSKKQYWKYTHTPFNDGPHPEVAVILDETGTPSAITGTILDEPISRFYIDGKYTVEHWQEDNTNRTADLSGRVDYEDYDKESNVAEVTFYIEGGASAPWITSIKTIPGMVKEGDAYQIQIGVDDAEKDVLSLTTEVYRDKKLINTHRKGNLQADHMGIYPPILTGMLPVAQVGRYQVVCTVRDWSGVGLGTYQFIVISEGKVTGLVNHTQDWDDNRKKYNLKRFSNEINYPIKLEDYLNHSVPRPRGTNVFWSGERFMLEAETEGNPSIVRVKIYSFTPQGAPVDTGYTTTLTKSGQKGKEGGDLWKGSLWDKGMINKWGRKTPQPLLFKFTAEYPAGKTKEDQATIIIDSQQDYWQLHRLW
jgi:hypothetical protein